MTVRAFRVGFMFVGPLLHSPKWSCRSGFGVEGFRVHGLEFRGSGSGLGSFLEKSNSMRRVGGLSDQGIGI